MKSTMKALVAVLATAVIVGSSFGQGAGPRGGAPKGGAQEGGRGPGGGMRRGGGRMNFDGEVLAKMNLTRVQQTSIKDLKAKVAGTMKAQYEKNKGNREAMMAAMKTVGQEYKTGLEKILTPAQQKEYKAAMKARMAEMRAKRGGAPGGKRGPGTPPPTP